MTDTDTPDDISSIERATASAMRIGSGAPDAPCGLTMTRRQTVQASWRHEDDARLGILVGYHWPFAQKATPEVMADELVTVTSASMRAAIISGDLADGTLGIPDLVNLTDVPDRDELDLRLIPLGKKVGRLNNRALARFLDRVRTAGADDTVRIEAGFHLAGGALEFAQIGVFGNDHELSIATHPPAQRADGTFTAPRTSLSGLRATISWPR